MLKTRTCKTSHLCRSLATLVAELGIVICAINVIGFISSPIHLYVVSNKMRKDQILKVKNIRMS